jgi:hypothetical protein
MEFHKEFVLVKTSIPLGKYKNKKDDKRIPAKILAGLKFPD